MSNNGFQPLQNETQRQDAVATLEAEIEKLVYELYGLTKEEINVVEGGK
jgi:hypothetical protein